MNPCMTQVKAKQNLVFCGSALSPEEKVGIKSCFIFAKDVFY